RRVLSLLLLLFCSRRPPPRSTPFPYTTLFRSGMARRAREHGAPAPRAARVPYTQGQRSAGRRADAGRVQLEDLEHAQPRARWQRSEEHRLNSSHVKISYAVFCLKKKII